MRSFLSCYNQATTRKGSILRVFNGQESRVAVGGKKGTVNPGESEQNVAAILCTRSPYRRRGETHEQGNRR